MIITKNNSQIRDYLYAEHYKAWPVQEAIKPHTDYQKYVNQLPSQPTEVVIAFGASSGKTVPRDQALYLRLKPAGLDSQYYYVLKSDVYQINTYEPNNDSVPSDYMLCVNQAGYSVYHPRDMVLTQNNNWLPIDLCAVLEPEYYGDDDNDNPIYIYKDEAVETHDGQWITRNDAVYCESDGDWYHDGEATGILEFNDRCNYWVHPDDCEVRWCADIDQYTARLRSSLVC